MGGVIQRLGVAFPLLWVEVVAIHLLWVADQGAVENRRGELPRERS
jgi:hypothetical protein